VEEKNFEKANVDLTNTTLFINRIMVFMMPGMMLLMNGVTLLIIWVGAHQVDQGAMQVGNMMAFMQYSIQIIMAFLMVSIVFIMMPRATVSAQRIAEVLETAPSVTDPVKPVEFSGDSHGTVEFQNVGFKYPGADDYVLHDISFTSAPGQTTAIVGGTGSGKSTLVNLVPRFYDVTEGKSWWTAWISGKSPSTTSAISSGISRKRPACSPALSKAISLTVIRTTPTER
jgi:ATP-binding cassette subfamily B protein